MWLWLPPAGGSAAILASFFCEPPPPSPTLPSPSCHQACMTCCTCARLSLSLSEGQRFKHNWFGEIYGATCSGTTCLKAASPQKNRKLCAMAEVNAIAVWVGSCLWRGTWSLRDISRGLCTKYYQRGPAAWDPRGRFYRFHRDRWSRF